VPLIGAVFWLAHANYRAFERLISNLKFPFFVVVCWVALWFFVSMALDINRTAQHISTLITESEDAETLPLNAVDVENIFQAQAKIQWMLLVGLSTAITAIVFKVAKDIFRPD
jgi:hypothetical protein